MVNFKAKYSIKVATVWHKGKAMPIKRGQHCTYSFFAGKINIVKVFKTYTASVQLAINILHFHLMWHNITIATAKHSNYIIPIAVIVEHNIYAQHNIHPHYIDFSIG